MNDKMNDNPDKIQGLSSSVDISKQESKDATKSEMNETTSVQDEKDKDKEAKDKIQGKNTIKPKRKKKRKKRKGISYLLELLIKILVTAFVLWGILTYVLGVYINTDNSSYPMIKDGDLCVTYKRADIIKGDEVAYKIDGKIRFGRVIATEGEEVDIRGGTVLVDGYNVVEDTIYETPEDGNITFPYVVGNGEVFILNDFRADNKDSRIYGGIPKGDLRGKIIFLMRRRGF